jgi:hypothetical protein
VTAQNVAFDFFAVSDLVNIFEDGYNCPSPQQAIDVFGIRGEYLSAQCVVHARTDLTRLKVSVSQLKQEGDKGSVPSASITSNFIGSVLIHQNTPNHLDSDLLRPAPALFPDYLSEVKTVSISEGTYQPIWLTIRIPSNAREGKYSGVIAVTSDKCSASIPVYLTVFPLTMPGESHLSCTMWYSMKPEYHDFGKLYSDKYYDILETIANNMAEHRQNVFRISLNTVLSTIDNEGKLSFNFSNFDRHCNVFWNTGMMDFLETGFVATFGETEGEGRWSSTEIVLRDFPVTKSASGEIYDMPGEDYLRQFLPAFESHLQDRGWLDKTLFHIADEPSVHNVIPWREASDFVHRYAPTLRRIDAIEMTYAANRLEVWVPKLNFLDTYFDIYKQAQWAGNELWYYTTGIYQGGAYPNRIVDGPIIDTRIMHWLNYRFGITGYLHWGYNQWTGDPYKDPGMHCGDGWQVYPKDDGVINSIRWEQLRNGIQDYEYFWLLEDKIKSLVSGKGDSFNMFDPANRGIELATRVIRTMTDFSRDSEKLYQVKKQVIDEILDLDTKPLLYVQTNPPELSTVHSRGPIEVIGMTDPGTEIIVNGKKLPVSSKGFFAEIFYVSLTADMIVIEAENQNGRKIITRKFHVTY